MEDKLKHSIFYFLHRYYPENRNNLTDEDWKIYSNLTNYLESDGKLSLPKDSLADRLKEIMEDKPEYKSKILLDEVFKYRCSEQ